MWLRSLCVLTVLFPFAASAQPVSVDLSGVTHGPTGPLPEGTAKHHALPPPGMDAPTDNMQESCLKPMELIGQPRNAIDLSVFKNTVRVLGPNDAATMDYSPQRTNILTDKQGIITAIRCG